MNFIRNKIGWASQENKSARLRVKPVSQLAPNVGPGIVENGYFVRTTGQNLIKNNNWNLIETFKIFNQVFFYEITNFVK